MEEKRMVKVTVDGKEYTYPYGTTYRTVAADFQDQFPCDILLVNREGKLCELHKVLDRDCSLKMVTAQDKPGIQTYERSAVFLMLKAFYDVAGRENVERLSVEFCSHPPLQMNHKGCIQSSSPLRSPASSVYCSSSGWPPGVSFQRPLRS